MVSFCANTACRKPLHYLREGKVYLFTRRDSRDKASRQSQPLEHYWLCGKCAKQWTLSIDVENGVKLVEIKKRQVRSAYDSNAAASAS